MFEIKGAFATAKCFATNIDDAAIEQIRAMCNQPFVKGSHVAIMPDAHAGNGCTIGTTMTIVNAVVPNIVGVDIGCGMYTVDLGKRPIDLPAFDEACNAIPSGMRVWERQRRCFDLEELHCFRQLKDIGRIECSIGTLGGGNHFIELDRADDGTQYLVIHSGSRNLGKQVAKLYQKLAVELHGGKVERFNAHEALVTEYMAAGRRTEINDALKELDARFRGTLPDVPKELCWLYGSVLEDYLHDVAICQRFAWLNRETIADEILRSQGLDVRDAFHTVHNYIDTDEMILRKGAIAAHEGERILIPLNMRDGSVLARGKGNTEWNMSAPHGAGRVLSRSNARASLSMDEYHAQMAGIYSTSIDESTLDEAPGAYKPIEDIIGPIAESVDIVEIMKPIYNFKAHEGASV